MQFRRSNRHVGASRTRAQLNAEIEQVLREVRGLVLVKGVLKKRGAGRAALEAHAREIEAARRRLADLVGARGLDAAGALGEAA